MAESITAFPLCWPAGWKRVRSRIRADFGKDKITESRVGDKIYANRRRERLTIAEGVRRLVATLKRMGISDNEVIVSTNVQPRLDGMPSSGQSEPQDPGAAVYWKKRGQQRCMAIDQYNRVADNIAAIAATLEFMRGIERHGGAEILDRAFLGFQAIPPPGMSEWRSILRDPNSLDEAEAAFRLLAKKHHPDHGGDVSEFSKISEAIQEARRVLMPQV